MKKDMAGKNLCVENTQQWLAVIERLQSLMNHNDVKVESVIKDVNEEYESMLTFINEARKKCLVIHQKLTETRQFSFEPVRHPDEIMMPVLSKREKEICALLMSGKRPKDIASHLSIEVQTVRNSLTIIYKKTGTDSLYDLRIFLTTNNGDK